MASYRKEAPGRDLENHHTGVCHQRKTRVSTKGPSRRSRRRYLPWSLKQGSRPLVVSPESHWIGTRHRSESFRSGPLSVSDLKSTAYRTSQATVWLLRDLKSRDRFFGVQSGWRWVSSVTSQSQWTINTYYGLPPISGSQPNRRPVRGLDRDGRA